MSDTPQKLLVAVDGSKGSGEAVSLACGLAKRLGVPVELVFVFQTASEALIGLPGGGISREDRKFFVPGAIEKLEEEASEAVFRAARKAVGDADVTIEEKTIFGLPADMLLNHADEVPGAMIVMGRRGHSNVTELFLGSVSQRVIHKAKCPVLLAP
ncbi:nucleotide-binding universal stress UspA family protein [Halospina denitrificans]|uniref:Nucleotide-binding universal stress UspA family protein n=1 Tax=Halospina denitrificans TaxID=332522 RepID=A0A4R7JTV0_9GAMM|nr:universal stress protein [Halospina denitrificans]TDT41730.1 nucleotide-binding universal stress UspA family protein [Halospina denitrificans]